MSILITKSLKCRPIQTGKWHISKKSGRMSSEQSGNTGISVIASQLCRQLYRTFRLVHRHGSNSQKFGGSHSSCRTEACQHAYHVVSTGMEMVVVMAMATAMEMEMAVVKRMAVGMALGMIKAMGKRMLMGMR